MAADRRGFRKHPWLMAGVIGLVAGLTAARATDLDAPPRFDGAGYSVLADALAHGQGYREIDHPDAPRHGHFPPGYPTALAGIWSLTGRSVRAAHLASIAFTSAAAVAAWAWFRTLYGDKVATWLGLAVAINWTWQRNGGSIQSEPLYLLLGTLTLLAATAAGRRGTITPGIGLGASLAVTILTRHVAGSLALAVGLDLILKRRTATAIAAGVTCLVLVSPWVAWLGAVREHTQAELLVQGGLVERIAAQGWFYLQRLPDQLTGPFVEVATVFRGPGPIASLANGWAVLASGLIVAGWVGTLRSARRRLAGLVPLMTLGL
ncbi:MAG: glycosyltransferase family 39 protein, partial [Isosphaeraceae bacterium]